MRIGVEANAYYKNPAGTGVYTRNLVDAWRAAGQDVRLFASARESRIDLAGKTPLRRGMNALRELVWIQRRVPALARREGVDVLFCPAFVSPVRTPCPCVLVIHDVGFLRYPETADTLFRLYVRNLLRFTTRTARLVVTGSLFSRSEIHACLGVPEAKIRVVPYGVARGFLDASAAADVQEVRARYGLSRPFILHVGTLEPRKNILTLLAAFAQFRQRTPGYQLALCGPKGWYYESLFRGSEKLGLGADVVFTGTVTEPDLVTLYRAAEFLAFPSLYEGFGLPLVEAMASGCPLVASNAGPVPEVVGAAAILVDPLDVSGFATAMRELAASPTRRGELAEKGRVRARSFSWEQTARATSAVLEEALTRAG